MLLHCMRTTRTRLSFNEKKMSFWSGKHVPNRHPGSNIKYNTMQLVLHRKCVLLKNHKTTRLERLCLCVSTKKEFLLIGCMHLRAVIHSHKCAQGVSLNTKLETKKRSMQPGTEG